MSLYWFPDNTVLCNFAAVSRLPLLEKVLDGRGRWAEAIAAEAAASARIYPKLASISTGGWLGEPIEVSDRDSERIERTRRTIFGGSPEDPTRHLGDAQTCHLLLTKPEYKGSFWITDDRDAGQYARGKGIVTRDTADLISEAIVVGCCTRDEGYRLLHLMADRGRHLRLPNHPSRL